MCSYRGYAWRLGAHDGFGLGLLPALNQAADDKIRLYLEAACQGERRKVMLLCLPSGGPVRRGCADTRKYLAGQPVGEADREAVETPTSCSRGIGVKILRSRG